MSKKQAYIWKIDNNSVFQINRKNKEPLYIEPGVEIPADLISKEALAKHIATGEIEVRDYSTDTEKLRAENEVLKNRILELEAPVAAAKEKK